MIEPSRRPVFLDLTKIAMPVGALTSIVANRIATEIWIRVFKEDPPVD